MKRLIQSVILAVLIVGAGPKVLSLQAPQFPKGTIHRFMIQQPVVNPAELASITRWLAKNDFDIAGINWREGRVEVIASTDAVKYLETRAGLSGKIIATMEPGSPNFAPDQRYLNPDRLTQKLQSIAAAYPQLTRLEKIGTSIQGRPIWALLVSDTPQSGDPRLSEKSAILIDGLHHAREVMTPEIVVDFAETLLKGVQTSRRAVSILSKWQFWFVPMLNVDGSNIVFTQNAWWRKNAHASLDSVHGVDINRNYVYKWNGCSGSSGDPNAQDYRGKAAGSEPETQALMSLAEKIRPAVSISYHSYSELVLFPFGCNGALTSENALVERIAKELAAKLPEDSGRGTYTPGAPWQILYDVDGSSMDHMYASFGALAYTFEVNQEFQPPYSVREPTLAKHRAMWIYFMNRVTQNLLTVKVTDSQSGKQASALIKIDAINPTHGELPFKTNSAGNYFKVLDPGRYVVSAKLADGRVGQVEVQMNGTPQEVILNVP